MRAVTPWRALAVWAIGLLAWVALAAPDLERRVAASELGPWRDAQLAVLAPFVQLRHLPEAAAWWPTRTLVAAGSSADAARPTATPGSWSSARPGSRSGSDEGEKEATTTPRPSTPPTPTPRRVPTADAPVRVLVIGDSIATDLGWALQNGDSPPIAVTVDTRPASGLARLDYFDWPAQLELDLARDDPEVVVIMVGGNDAQGFLVEGRPLFAGTAEWRGVYATRVRALMELARGGGRDVLWVGLPIMADAAFAGEMRELNAAYAAEARGAGVTYVDSWSLFADVAGRYAAFLPDGDGHLAPMRQADGIHLSMAGATRLAARVLDTIGSEWGSD